MHSFACAFLHFSCFSVGFAILTQIWSFFCNDFTYAMQPGIVNVFNEYVIKPNGFMEFKWYPKRSDF